MEMAENPAPTNAFQSCFGPATGQDADQLVSLEIPLRSGPRHRYQSKSGAAIDAEPARLNSAQSPARPQTSFRSFMRGTVVRTMEVSMRRRTTARGRS